MSPLRCSACNARRDVEDNFCRRCGHQITVNLPAPSNGSLPVGPAGLPVIRSGVPPTVLRSLAVLAVGTGLEWVARRLAGNAAKVATRAVIPGEKGKKPKARAGSMAEAVTIDEVVYVRQVHLRR